MPTLRRATVDDAALITRQRHLMLADNDSPPTIRLQGMNAAFSP